MAITSYKTFLMKGAGTSTITYTKLVDIVDFPDLGSAPEQIDVTTLSDGMKLYEQGIQDAGSLSFTANYNATDYQTLIALKGTETPYAVWFGGTESGGSVTPSGASGKVAFKGKLDVFINGAGVNEAVKMTITIAPTTVPTWSNQ